MVAKLVIFNGINEQSTIIFVFFDIFIYYEYICTKRCTLVYKQTSDK